MKKIVAILMCTALCWALVGCTILQKQDTPPTTTTHTTGENETTQTDGVTTTTTVTPSTETVNTNPTSSKQQATQLLSSSTPPNKTSTVSNKPTIHTHTYDQKVVTVDFLKSKATCQTAMTYYYSCRCGQKGDTAFTWGSPLAHTYVASVKEPTCSDQGYTEHICSCGESYKDNYVQQTHEHEFVHEQTWMYGKDFYTYVCQKCGIFAASHGDAEGLSCGDPAGEVKYYVIEKPVLKNGNWTLGDYHIVIYGNGLMGDYESNKRPMWHQYLKDATAITIEEGVTTIGSYCFVEPQGYSSITVHMADSVTVFKPESFNLNIEKLVYGNGVEYIYAMPNNKNTKEIFLPRAVEYIGNSSNTLESGTEIFYQGTREEFLNITILYGGNAVTMREYLNRSYSQGKYPRLLYVYVNASEVGDKTDLFDTLAEWTKNGAL